MEIPYEKYIAQDGTAVCGLSAKRVFFPLPCGPRTGDDQASVHLCRRSRRSFFGHRDRLSDGNTNCRALPSGDRAGSAIPFDKILQCLFFRKHLFIRFSPLQKCLVQSFKLFPRCQILDDVYHFYIINAAAGFQHVARGNAVSIAVRQQIERSTDLRRIFTLSLAGRRPYAEVEII